MGSTDPVFFRRGNGEGWPLFRFLSNPQPIVANPATINLKGITMKFAFVPKAQYRIGQIIKVHNRRAEVVKYAHTGRNIEVAMLDGKPERVVCICTDAQPIEAL